MRQRLVVSLRKSFDLLSLQITDRDGHLGGDISFLCQLVNRRSHQTIESRGEKGKTMRISNHNTTNLLSTNRFTFFVKNICFSDIIVSSCSYATSQTCCKCKSIFKNFLISLVPNVNILTFLNFHVYECNSTM